MESYESDKRELILSAAMNLFRRFNYDKTSMEDIAKEARIGKGTIYYYFKSKEDILLELIEREFSQLYEELSEMLESSLSFDEKFAKFIEVPIEGLMKHSTFTLEVFNRLPDMLLNRLESYIREQKKRMQSIVLQIFNEGKEQGVLRDDIPFEVLGNMIIRWFLFLDENIFYRDFGKISRVIEVDYKYFIQIMLKGLLK